MDKKGILKVAIDAIEGRVEKFSSQQTSDALRKAFIELNGGSDKINRKNFHRGNALFELVQEILPVMIETGLRSDPLMMNLVEYRNIALGDVNEFIIKNINDLLVSSVARGIGSVRRQRLMGRHTLRVETETKIVKVYEDLDRLMAGRISFEELVEAVYTAFTRQALKDIHTAIESIGAATQGMNANFVVNGTFDEEELVRLIDRVEAITGKTAKIVGTRLALRRVRTDAEGEVAKSSMYDAGFYGKFNGTDMVVMKQATNKDGSFILSNDRLLILASDDRPIKFVNEGEGLIIEGNPLDNADLTQEYAYAQLMGLAVVASAPLGVYNLA